MTLCLLVWFEHQTLMCLKTSSLDGGNKWVCDLWDTEHSQWTQTNRGTNLRVVMLPISHSTNSFLVLQNYDVTSTCPSSQTLPKHAFPTTVGCIFGSSKSKNISPPFQLLMSAVWLQSMQFLRDFSPDCSNAAPASSNAPCFCKHILHCWWPGSVSFLLALLGFAPRCR